MSAKQLVFFCGVLLGLHFTVDGQRTKYEYEFAPVLLMESPNVNSYAEEIFPLYDKSYDTLFFVRSHHNENVGRDKINQDIWYSHKDANGAWSSVKNFKALNNAENNSIVGISGTTETLYMLNSYTSTLVRNKGIVKSKYKNGEWSKPVTIDFEVDTHNNLYSFFINHTEDVIVITMFNEVSEGKEDLFVSLKSDQGHWRDPIYLGHTINSAGYETSPFLSDDKKTLFFTSDGFGGYGDGDVFMSERLDDSWGNWTLPKNLGENVNSEKFDAYFSLYENGEYLLASNRAGKFSDIYRGTWTRKEVEVPEDVKIVEKIVEVERKIELPESFSIFFGSNAIKFDDNIYRESLDEVATYMKANTRVGLILEGQTDKIGDDTYNLILSLQRAKSVEDYLKAKMGVKGNDDRITVVPAGESKAGENNESSRRVDLKFVILE